MAFTTVRAPDLERASEVMIQLERPAELAAAVADMGQSRPILASEARRILARTTAASLMGSGWRIDALPGVLDVLRPAWVALDAVVPRQEPEHVEALAKFVATAAGIDDVQILRARMEKEQWRSRLNDALLVLKFVAIGAQRPLGEAAALLRLCYALSATDLPEGVAPFGAYARAPFLLPEELVGAAENHAEAKPAKPPVVTRPDPIHVLETAVAKAKKLHDHSRTTREFLASGTRMVPGSLVGLEDVSLPVEVAAEILATRAEVATSSLRAEFSERQTSADLIVTSIGGTRVVGRRRAGTVPGWFATAHRAQAPRGESDAVMFSRWRDLKEGLADIGLSGDRFVMAPPLGPEANGGPEVPPEPSHLEPAGRTDLLLVRETLTGYRAADISHVENIMIGETRSRVHTQRTLVESEVTESTERTTEESRDLETHDRSALTREISSVVKEDLEATGTVTVTSRGPTKVVASASVGYARSIEDSASRAEEYARETITRAVQRTSETTQRSVRRRLEQETNVENTHAFARSSGAETHVSGIYQYLERVSEARILCYGEREVYDILVPEPAALIWHFAMSDEAVQVHVPAPDAEFFATLTSDNIEQNRERAIREFRVFDIPPPFAPVRQLSFSHAATGKGNDAKMAASKELDIPEGYVVTLAQVSVNVEVESNITPNGGVSVGGRAATFVIDNLNTNIGQTTFDIDLDNVTGPGLAVSVIADNFTSIAITVHVTCELTDRARKEWALEAYGRVADRFEIMRQEYADAVREHTALEAAPEYDLPRAARARLDTMMRLELQRSAIAAMRNAPVDLDLMKDHLSASGDTVLPASDLTALGAALPEIRFLSQAFEWQHMSFVFYPYYWGRRSEWERTVLQPHADPAFGEFLRAGAARIQVPVVPGFEDVVAHFMHTGEVYGGNDMPHMGGAHYIPFIDERLTASGAPGEETPWPEGAPRKWDVIQPTSLVLLRGSDLSVLPEWDRATGDPR